ncbi:hypothetical protein HHK36_017644 [Tetracentron sinense]|uniref:DNA (cytosine-5-)-methyltransferase n=1 Tax=Tetracentron sinense TaxID=13715 RepID=A0A835DCS9_TETSI|nr:hypothetical protein HHK36_017644 [Tetracentron sinense]
MLTSGKRKTENGVSSPSKAPSTKKIKKAASEMECCFVGEPLPDNEARERWPERYEKKKKSKSSGRSGSSKDEGDEEGFLQAKCHYTQAEVEGCIFNLYDDAYVKAADGEPDYIGKVVELFETTDKEPYFTAQWFFKAEDTVIKDHANLIDKRRVFYSDIRNDNPLDCIISKIKIVQVAPNIDLDAKERTIPPCDFYYDMKYSLGYNTFANLPTESTRAGSEPSSTISSEVGSEGAAGEIKSDLKESSQVRTCNEPEMTLLDLYSGCGAMSTGLCLGASISGLKLVTRWAVDLNQYACESLKLNHPETEVRNEAAEDFLSLLKEWEKLCKNFSLLETKQSRAQDPKPNIMEDEEDVEDGSELSSEEFEVGRLLSICYGDPNEINKPGLYFKVRWKGYGPSEDTWEPIDGLRYFAYYRYQSISNCEERIKEFVTNGYNSNLLPLPGDVDVICGGPPCQGISGFNRFRNKEAPLEDSKNHQLVVFMDIVNYLKPKHVLMENVVDILRFAAGFLGRYALGRLVAMNYQARLGMMAAGCYGLPQFRMRKLSQYPLPTHEVVVRGVIPTEFERNVVAYDENHPYKLEKALLLGDAISDLPPVHNDENRDEMPYGSVAQTEFQRYIRLSKHDMATSIATGLKPSQKSMLYDHRPLQLNEDDYQRVCHIPKLKGANFRNLPGVVVRPDNKVEWDESIERVFLPSGKPLVPDYAMTFVRGTSSKPFGRLWWDETVPTVVTRAEPHNQAILHPDQDRVLSIRENARLQGFPDFYKLCGPVKERYIQVGNAVAVPVARALGYAFGLACKGECTDESLISLPPNFPNHLERASSPTTEVSDSGC